MDSGNAKFYDTNLTLISYSNEVLGDEGYEYEKTGEKTGILRLNNGAWTGELFFDDYLNARGERTGTQLGETRMESLTYTLKRLENLLKLLSE